MLQGTKINDSLGPPGGQPPGYAHGIHSWGQRLHDGQRKISLIKTYNNNNNKCGLVTCNIIHSIECSRHQCGMPQCSNSQLTDTLSHCSNKITGQNLWEGVRFSACRKPESTKKTYQCGYGIGKPNSCTTTVKLHWLKTNVRAFN